MHTDYGLLTLIPAQTGAPGLEILNWTTFEWDKVEEQVRIQPMAILCACVHFLSEIAAVQNSNPRQCVVFASESLQLLTNGAILPTVHRVVRSRSCAARIALLDLLFECGRY